MNVPNNKIQNVQGFEIQKVEDWIKENVKGLKPPLKWKKLEGGHSNLTYMINDFEGASAVIRRPPLGKLLPKAHDMSREWALISNLAPTGFPVPKPLGFCDDLDITGALFYVMGFSEGKPLHSAKEASNSIRLDDRATLAYSFIDTLALLHSLDPDEIGLGELGRKEDYIGRQVKTWYRSWMASIEPANYDDKRAHNLQEYFLSSKPDQQTASVVHGDYGFHNCLIGDDAKVSAVVDWEISSLGDPLADLAYTLKSWPEAHGDASSSLDLPSSIDGLPLRKELIDRYQKQTGLNVDQLDFYFGFNHWKSAAIIHGVYARYREGKKSTEGIDLDEIKSRIDASLAAADFYINRYKER